MKCLESIKRAIHDPVALKDYQIIVVDRYSDDRTVDSVYATIPFAMVLQSRAGRGKARNFGVENALGEILIFLDSDIEIKPDTLQRMANHLKEHDAVIGTYSTEHPYSNFASQYKNLFVHYTYISAPRYVNWFFSAIGAVRKEVFKRLGGFRDFEAGEDIEFGQRIGQVYSAKDIQVVHHHCYTLAELLKNDFCRARNWVKMFMTIRKEHKTFDKGGFANATWGLIASVLAVWLSSSLFILKVWELIPLCVTFFMVLNSRFLIFIGRLKGIRFFLKSLLFTFFDHLTFGLGVLVGLLSSLS